MPPELRTLFDRVADHFPGHTMQRVRLPDGRIRYTYASPGMRETFGIDPGAVLSETVASHDWVHPDDRASFVAALHRSADLLETLDEEIRVLGADGRVRWVRSIGHPRAMPDGGVVWDGIALDVTARRETEAALQRMLSLARDAETSQTIGGPRGRIGRSLAVIGRQLELLAVMIPPEAAHHLALIRVELTSLLGGDAVKPNVALTQRQTDVLALLVEGMPNREIGVRLGIDPGTAKLHVAAILKRLGAANRTEAVARARAFNLFS